MDALCGNDFVADTPQQASPYSGCPNHPQTSCSSTDMFMNYMDYTNDACMNLFTDGQSNRMLALFNPGGVRESFVNCSLIANICENPFSINGPDIICSSNEETYTIDIPSNVDINWSTSGEINIQTESNDSVTITAVGNGVLEAEISNSCGDNVIIEKEIDSGSPSITAEGYYYNNSPTYSLSPYYSIPNNPVSETPATVTANFSFEGAISSDAQILSQSDPSITWDVSLGSEQLSFYFDFYGSPDPWNPQPQTIVWRVTAESPCGTETYDVAFYSEVNNYSYFYYPNPATTDITIENTSFNKSIQANNSSSNNNSKGSIVIYDFNGSVVQTEEYDLNSESFNLDVSKLKPGKYFMKIGAAREEETHQIIIRR